MKTVTVSKEQEIRLGPYEYAAALFPEIVYLLSDKDAEDMAGKTGGDCTIGEPGYRVYRGEDLNGKALLYAVLGDYGDALLDIQTIKTLERKYPSAVIDVMTTIDTYMLFQQFSLRSAWRAYPVLGESVEHYDYLAANEGAFDPFFHSGKEKLDWCRNLLGGNLDPPPLPLSLNPAMKRTMAIGNPSRAIAVLHIGGNGRINDYPLDRCRELIRLLAEKNFEIVICGFTGDPRRLSSLPVENIMGKDCSVFEILAVLSRADLIIAGDSFSARTGGLLGKETLVLLNTEDREAYGLYPTAEVLSPSVPCSPCYRQDRCPLGYEKCEAFLHESAAPARVLERALCKLNARKETQVATP